MTKPAFDVVVWDFDGVLDANVEGGVFLWARDLEADWGLSSASLQTHLFDESFQSVMRGEVDLLARIAVWFDAIGGDADPEAFLAYWFEKDAWVDQRMAALLERCAAAGLRNAIATNNETRHCAYIAGPMGFEDKVERLFCSGRLGCAKPEPAFFDQVARALDAPPERLFLIDDNRDNVAAARALGWRVHLFEEDGHDAVEQALAV